MNYKKLIYCSGLVGFIACSLLTHQKIQYEENVKNHYESECNHDGNIIAHRGFSSVEVENSFNSIKKAASCDCTDGIELDIRLTKDNELVLSHNSKISGLGKVSEKSLDEINEKNYKVSSIPKLQLLKSCLLGKDGKLIYDRYKKTRNDEGIVTTLDNVLDNIECKKTLLVDMKFSSEDNTKFMNKVNEIFSKYSGDFDIILQASEYDMLSLMKEKYPNYKYQLIIGKEKNLKYLDSDFEMFGVRKNLVTKEIVDEQISKGKTISVWTINSYDDYKILKEELDSRINDILIITDYPDEICYLNNNKEKVKIFK